jgi:hypothetical protein
VLRKDNVYLAQVQKNNNLGMPLESLVPVYLFRDEALDFDKVLCRFDGANLWYEGTDPSNDPSKGEYLRETMRKMVQPNRLMYSGLTFEEKAAYSIRFNLDKKFREGFKEEALKRDVEHAGGRFIKFLERTDNYAVTYEVDGDEYTSSISKNEGHRVLTAGICLSGGDREFDLASLITVLREGKHEGLIHRY